MAQIHIPDPTPILDHLPTKYSVLVYAPPKVGKTIFGASWAKAGDVLMIDTDEGYLSIITIANPIIPIEWKARIKRQVLPRAHPKNPKSPLGWKVFMDILKSLDATGTWAGVKPRTLVIDSMTTLSSMALDDVLGTTDQLHVEVTQPQWGKLRARFLKMIDMAKGLPDINFVLICHELYKEDKLTKRIMRIPDVVGKLATQIALWFDEVYRLEARPKGDTVERFAVTQGNQNNPAGTRFGLPKEIPPYYSSIEGKLEALQNQLAVRQAKGGQAQKQLPIKTNAVQTQT